MWGQGWPIKPPDVLIATPAAVLNHIFAYDPRRRRRRAFVRDACCVVFDEADMLLSGGFAGDLDKLINLLKEEERRVAKVNQFAHEVPEQDLQPWTEFSVQEEILEEEKLPCESAEGPTMEFGSGSDATVNTLSSSPSKKFYKRSKQYIFVAATLPDNGKKTPGAILKRLFPDAQWLQGSLLHCHNPRVLHSWIQVTEDTRIRLLLEAVSGGESDSSQDTPIKRTMVFANSVEAVNAICRVFTRAGMKSLVYHRDIPVEERSDVLSSFQHEGGLLLCTDAAARGIDVPDINHIVQAEFASSVVDFLHRVGRTGRAGRAGLVTNFYSEANVPLVQAVQKALNENRNVEGAFSRKKKFPQQAEKAWKQSLRFQRCTPLPSL